MTKIPCPMCNLMTAEAFCPKCGYDLRDDDHDPSIETSNAQDRLRGAYEKHIWQIQDGPFECYAAGANFGAKAERERHKPLIKWTKHSHKCDMSYEGSHAESEEGTPELECTCGLADALRELVGNE